MSIVLVLRGMLILPCPGRAPCSAQGWSTTAQDPEAHLVREQDDGREDKLLPAK